ncbi:MAG: hypothetical protein AAB547_03215 [Patescibacteria group bacterium]
MLQKKLSLSFKMFVSVALLLSVGAFVMTADASHSWGNYHWARTANPFTLQLGNNVTGTWGTHLATASTDWSVSSVLDTAVVTGLTNSKNCKAVKGRVEVCNRTYGNNGWLGIAQIWISGSHITQGAVKVNDTYFNTLTYNNPNEKLHVMCQEIGHTLGLDHQSTDGGSLGTCMDYFSNTGTNAGSTQSTHPNDHDYAQLEAIYAHLDSVTTLLGKVAGTSARAGNDDIDVTDPKEWGKEVRKDKKGKESLYERDLGKGNKLFTFVVWAE